MSLFVLKILLTPLLIALATLAARRWGPAVGGWLAGLPLTSGPVSVYFAVEQGPAFAADAARGTLLGLVAVAAFCVAYARTATASGWLTSFTLGLVSYSLITFGLSLGAPELAEASVLTVLLLLVALMALGRPQMKTPAVRSPWWDLPLRMLTATAIVLAITAAAASLGPQWSGLLSPFPVFASVMAVFSHRQGGADSAQRLLRGVLSRRLGQRSRAKHALRLLT